MKREYTRWVEDYCDDLFDHLQDQTGKIGLVGRDRALDTLMGSYQVLSVVEHLSRIADELEILNMTLKERGLP